MLSLNSLFIFSEKPEQLSKFYQEVLGEKPVWVEDGYWGFAVGSFLLTIAAHDQVYGATKEPERIIINFEAEDVEKEFGRIKRIGAKVIREPYHPSADAALTIATLADPDGNYFQLMSPLAQETGPEGDIVMKDELEEG